METLTYLDGTALPEDLADAVRESLATARRDAERVPDFVHVSPSSEVFSTAAQTWALFWPDGHRGGVAYDVTDNDGDYRVVLVDGQVVGQFPDEGPQGLLQVGYHESGPLALFARCGWLNADEVAR